MENCGGLFGSQRHRGGVHDSISYTLEARILRHDLDILDSDTGVSFVGEISCTGVKSEALFSWLGRLEAFSSSVEASILTKKMKEGKE